MTSHNLSAGTFTNRFESNMTINLVSLQVQLLIDVLSIVNNDFFVMVQERFSHDIFYCFYVNDIGK